jgi:hypothetical protein
MCLSRGSVNPWELKYEGQRSKVRNSEELHTELLSVPGTDGRKRKMLCLPLEAIGDWASTIDPGTLRPEVVEALTDLLEESEEGLENPETLANTQLQVVTPDELAVLVVDAADGILKRILGNNLVPRLDELKQIRFEMLQREIDCIEDLAADTPEVRAKAQTYIDDAKANYEAWLADFDKGTSPGPIH